MEKKKKTPSARRACLPFPPLPPLSPHLSWPAPPGARHHPMSWTTTRNRCLPRPPCRRGGGGSRPRSQVDRRAPWPWPRRPPRAWPWRRRRRQGPAWRPGGRRHRRRRTLVSVFVGRARRGRRGRALFYFLFSPPFPVLGPALAQPPRFISASCRTAARTHTHTLPVYTHARPARTPTSSPPPPPPPADAHVKFVRGTRSNQAKKKTHHHARSRFPRPPGRPGRPRPRPGPVHRGVR